MQNPLIKGAAELLVLSVLSKGPLHGYAIRKELTRVTLGALGLSEAALYPTLHEMKRLGNVSSRETIFRGRRRIVYRLTARGRARLGVLRTEWDGIIRSVNRVLGTRVSH